MGKVIFLNDILGIFCALTLRKRVNWGANVAKWAKSAPLVWIFGA
ncbi:hypothetical protein SAMN05444385_101282 [Tritonibacter mobilis]|nr:hypothetical protein SCH4B_2505 [Ruegeria sp. TrichCH4B]SDW11068.1 hypothetical protein SAMN05444385_101282 [Tritonibacter mobilis]